MSTRITEAMVEAALAAWHGTPVKNGDERPAMRNALDAAIEAALSTEPGEAEGWCDMSSAPKDGTVVNVVGRYPDATAGFPRYAAFLEEDGDWFELSRNKPERIVPWAWRPRDAWPQEPAASPLNEDTRHGR